MKDGAVRGLLVTSMSLFVHRIARGLMRLMLCLAAVAAVLGAGPVSAQGDYPAKPIRFVVGFPPGGGNDIIARLLGSKLQEIWGQAVVIDNRPGANSIIATEIVAKAPPDGYTLLVNASGMVINPSMYATLPYDALRDFEPVTMLVSFAFVLVVNPSLPAHSMTELVQYAKSQPGKLNYSSAAAAFQLAVELLKIQTGISLNHVPYKGSVPAISAVLANETQLTIVDATSAVPQIRAGKLRALAVALPRRSASLPEVPTMAEAGVPDFEISGWAGLFAPAGTPRPVVVRLHQQAVRILQMPDIREKLLNLGAEPVANSPEEFAAQMKAQIAKWISVARTANIKAQ